MVEYTDEEYVDYMESLYGGLWETCISLTDSWSIETRDVQSLTDNDVSFALTDENMNNILILDFRIGGLHGNYDKKNNELSYDDLFDHTDIIHDYAKVEYKSNTLKLTYRIRGSDELITETYTIPQMSKLITRSDYEDGAIIIPDASHSFAQDLVEIRNILAENLTNKKITVDNSDGIRTLANKISDIKYEPYYLFNDLIGYQPQIDYYQNAEQVHIGGNGSLNFTYYENYGEYEVNTTQGNTGIKLHEFNGDCYFESQILFDTTGNSSNSQFIMFICSNNQYYKVTLAKPDTNTSVLSINGENINVEFDRDTYYKMSLHKEGNTLDIDLRDMTDHRLVSATKTLSDTFAYENVEYGLSFGYSNGTKFNFRNTFIDVLNL